MKTPSITDQEFDEIVEELDIGMNFNSYLGHGGEIEKVFFLAGIVAVPC